MILNSYGDIIEMAIPTSIKKRTLTWVRAGNREWTTNSEPNQVCCIQLNEAILTNSGFL